MLSLRRYGTYLGVAACFLLLVTYFQRPLLSRTVFDPHRVIPPPIDPSSGRLRWDQVPVRYPVNSLTPIPSKKPLKLPKVQHDFPVENPQHASTRKARQTAVKETFERCWRSYRKLAWMKDELAPLSGGSKDGFGGWAASLVDNLDNLWIMGMKAEFDEAVRAAVSIDLSRSTIDQINVFETTIRHLGGFLSAYDLSGDERLLDKAKEFGDMLIVAFDTPNRMPITRWNPLEAFDKPQEADEAVLVAEVGSLTMEFTRLSLLTGDAKWYDAVDRIVQILYEQQDKTYLPGMWPVTVNTRDEIFTKDTLFTLSAMSDSVYEYNGKMHALLGGVDPRYEKMYNSAMAAAIEYVLWRPMTPDNADILISGKVRKSGPNFEAHLDPEGQHLVCFAGGMFALGGKLFSNQAHVDIGKKLTDGCIWTYKALPLGIMPEVFTMVPCASRLECSWNETAWKAAIHDSSTIDRPAEVHIVNKRLPPGFTQVSDRRYILRPEAIESVLMLYRITGEEYLLDAAWDMFTAIRNATETPLANAALRDITYTKEAIESTGDEIQTDSMESFWMAETLKYFYLIFSEPNVISLDEWVFNTEAHPFRRRLLA